MSKAKEAEKQNIWARLQNVDRRVMFFITFIVFLPILYPLSIPLVPSEWGKMFADTVTAVPDGSYVLAGNEFGIDDTPKTWAKRALTNQLLRKNCKIIEISFGVTAPPSVENVYQNLIDKTLNKQYGVDYIFLPYVAGMVIAWSATAKDIRAATGGVDYYGTSLDTYPIMKGHNSIRDFQFLTETGHHSTNDIEPVVMQWASPSGLPLVVISSGISHATQANFVATGLIKGCLEGLVDMATYEQLIKDPGLNLQQMDVVSLHHLSLVAIIILGNVFYFLGGGRKSLKSEVKK